MDDMMCKKVKPDFMQQYNTKIYFEIPRTLKIYYIGTKVCFLTIKYIG